MIDNVRGRGNRKISCCLPWKARGIEHQTTDNPTIATRGPFLKAFRMSCPAKSMLGNSCALQRFMLVAACRRGWEGCRRPIARLSEVLCSRGMLLLLLLAVAVAATATDASHMRSSDLFASGDAIAPHVRANKRYWCGRIEFKPSSGRTVLVFRNRSRKVVLYCTTAVPGRDLRRWRGRPEGGRCGRLSRLGTPWFHSAG